MTEPPALAELTTMRLGGPGRRHVVAADEASLIEAVRAADAAQEDLLLVAGGSNLVIADQGFAGTVVQVASRGVSVEASDQCGGVLVRVAAGEPWDAFVADAVARGWSGIEALSGIPGSVGATPVQNVGAYGQEVRQTIARVRVWDRASQSVRTMANAELKFAYRDSVLKQSMGTDPAAGAWTPRYIVLDVTFQLRLTELSQPVAYADLAASLGVAQGERAPLTHVRDAVLGLRRKRGMVLDAADHDTWSCGSFFTNPLLTEAEFAALEARARRKFGAQAPAVPQFPAAEGHVKTSAAWLIDKAGFTRGHGSQRTASLSTKHTLALTNRGAASAQDIVALAREIRDGVYEAFGVTLVNEPVLVGLEL